MYVPYSFKICVYFVVGHECMTLADIIGQSKIESGLYTGKRVRLSSAEVTEYGTRIPMEACGRLVLEDIYTEKFLLCHAFIGGKYDPVMLVSKALSKIINNNNNNNTLIYIAPACRMTSEALE